MAQNIQHTVALLPYDIPTQPLDRFSSINRERKHMCSAFIYFRSALSEKAVEWRKKQKANGRTAVEDQTALSTTASVIWHQMSQEQRRPFEERYDQDNEVYKAAKKARCLASRRAGSAPARKPKPKSTSKRTRSASSKPVVIDDAPVVASANFSSGLAMPKPSAHDSSLPGNITTVDPAIFLDIPMGEPPSSDISMLNDPMMIDPKLLFDAALLMAVSLSDPMVFTDQTTTLNDFTPSSSGLPIDTSGPSSSVGVDVDTPSFASLGDLDTPVCTTSWDISPILDVNTSYQDYNPILDPFWLNHWSNYGSVPSCVEGNADAAVGDGYMSNLL